MTLPENADDPALAGRRRMVLLLLAAVQFTSIVDFMIVMPLGPQLMRTLDIGPKHFGWVVSSYTLAAGVAGLVASTVLDRFGRKATFLALYAGFLVGTLCCGIAPTYEALLAARIVTGAFGGVLGGQALTIIADLFPESQRGRATGILMSAFALASVLGVPAGIFLGTRFGWHTPFLVLVALGTPLLAVALAVMPPLRDHVSQHHAHPLTQLRETLTHPNHLRAFALIVTLMFGGFSVIPYVSAYYVANVGVTETQLTIVFAVAGACTLIGSPVIGRLADRHGKLLVYRVVAPISALAMIVLTNLPRVGVIAASATSAGLMLTNAGRMVAAMSMVTSAVEPRKRGGFMGVNSSLQHMATGAGAAMGGQIIATASDGTLQHFPTVGLIGVTTTLISIWLAGRLRMAAPSPPMTPERSLAAAAEADADAGEPLASLESA
jgi:predicted MFS family arabinose efflux permease